MRRVLSSPICFIFIFVVGEFTLTTSVQFSLCVILKWWRFKLKKEINRLLVVDILCLIGILTIIVPLVEIKAREMMFVLKKNLKIVTFVCNFHLNN